MRNSLQSLLRPLRFASAGTVQHRTAATVTGSGPGPSDQYVLESHYEDTPLPSGGLTQYLLDKFSAFSSSVAMLDGVTGQSVTYGSLVDSLHRWGAVVQSRSKEGAAPPTVAVYMINSADYASLFLGTLVVGAVATLLNPAYTAVEVARQLEDSGAHLLVVDPGTELTAIKALKLLQESNKITSIPEIFVIGSSSTGITDLRSLLNDKTAPYATPVSVSSENVGILPYSSGTTGLPKGVSVKHGSMTANIEMMKHPEFSPMSQNDTPDVIVGMLPFYHIYGLQIIMTNTLAEGGTVISLSGFNKDQFLNVLRKYKPTILPTVPPLLKFLVESGEVTKEDLSSFHSVYCGAAPVSKSSMEKFQEKTGGNAFFGEGFGMTEILVTHATPRSNQKLGYCGKSLPHVKARVVSIDTGESLPPGERGELLIKTPGLMAGYHNNSEATRATIDESGWLHTGDIAVYTEDGFFSIVDRIKELVKVKGFQVSPSELEDVLLKHPGVADVGVVGIPHDKHGEVPRAYVIKSSRQDISTDDVHRYMEENLSAHKQLLGGVKFVKELPKNPTGKLLRRVLKEIAEKE